MPRKSSATATAVAAAAAAPKRAALKKPRAVPAYTRTLFRGEMGRTLLARKGVLQAGRVVFNLLDVIAKLFASEVAKKSARLAGAVGRSTITADDVLFVVSKRMNMRIIADDGAESYVINANNNKKKQPPAPVAEAAPAAKKSAKSKTADEEAPKKSKKAKKAAAE